MKTISAKNLMCTIAANVNNLLLTDKQFREFVRNNAGICKEVLEWRETMAKHGKDFSEHLLRPKGESGTPLTPERKTELKGTIFRGHSPTF